jgi:hypothetical protein
MGKSVMAALEKGLAEQRQTGLAAAADSIKDLRRAGRIQKDLY